MDLDRAARRREAMIDSHHHFWDPARYEYPWMAGEEMDPVRRPYGPDDLRPELERAGVTGSVLVQAVADLRETRELLAVAAATDYVRGVVGWVDLTSPAVGDDLDALLDGDTSDRLVGIRHQVHDEPDPQWLCRGDVQRGLRAVQERGLAYDLLLRAREIPAAVRTVAAFPQLRFVLDHIAKPRIGAEADEEWSRRIPALAAHPNVDVKLSGLITEADWRSWTAADLRPFVEAVVEWFGLERVMFGSDWPVCLLAAGSYGEVAAALAETLGSLSPAEEALVYHDNAARAYRLDATTT
jgi:L-fuconolactonase